MLSRLTVLSFWSRILSEVLSNFEVLEMDNIDEIIHVIFVGFIVANFLISTCRVLKAIELCNECLFILDNTPLIEENELYTLLYNGTCRTMSRAYCLINDYTNAIKYIKKRLRILHECGDRNEECEWSIKLATLYLRQSKYSEGKELCEKALLISTEIGDRNGEASCYIILGNVFQSVGEYDRAKEYYEKALGIKKEVSDREGEATCYDNLGTIFKSVGEYDKAKECHEKALAISKEIGDRNGQAFSYRQLGSVLQSTGEYEKAKKYLKAALLFDEEIGSRDGEASLYGKLGMVFQSCGEYDKANEYHKKALAIREEIGDRKGEASSYSNLGTVHYSVGEYVKAKEYHMKALAISKEIGDRNGEAFSCGKLGSVLQSTGEYEKATKYLEAALLFNKEIGNRDEEAFFYGNLGIVFQSVGEYDKANEYFKKALAIRKETGNRKAEASTYSNLGTVHYSVGEFDKAKEYYEKALDIREEISDKEGEGADCGNLGTVFISLGEYDKAKEYLQKALTLREEIGDKKGEAAVYGNLGAVFQTIGDYNKAREFLEKALTISKEIGDRKREALVSSNLGFLFEFLGEYVEAEENHKTALAISEEIGDVKEQPKLLCNLGFVMLQAGKIQEALSYLLPSIQKCENMREFLRDNDQFKISFSHENDYVYWVLTAFFCAAGNPNRALYVSELCRARALADLMSAKYSVKNQISANPQSWVGIESVMDKEPTRCTCLYFSYDDHDIFLWILKARRFVHFQKVNGKEMIVHNGLIENLDEFLTNERFRSVGILPEEHCEDRSLNDIEQKPCEEDIRTASRMGKNGKDNQQSLKRNLSLCQKLIIAPVVHLIEGPEIIIVPDRSLYSIPFAALPDESGNYLSETFRIRVVPSLTTLKLIQDSPADYHSQTGALIVGNPDVGKVHLHGRKRTILSLPCAENEATMIGEKLGVDPLLGKQATKQAVLQVINTVSLIHFAAHGDAERGEIALAPAFRTPNKTPREEDYLLTMSDISKVQLRAKLVVLSCCHSGRGHIRTEGVVGIARAFLGSGARSVLVALWALDDSATEQFMSRFYEHLVGGDSASESLHEAMKWMRSNGYSEVRQWAPFMLIGDNVTFDFGKSK
ncbi:uncharacterized protein LOC144639152 isoform X3 [Oculina patagonica]